MYLFTVCFAVLVPCMYAFKPRQQQQQQQKIEQKSASSVSIKQKCDFGAQLKQKSACKAVFRRIHVKLSELMNFDIWKNRRYVLWAVAVPLGLFGYFVPYVHLVIYPIAVKCKTQYFSGISRILYYVFHS